jgi:hypothetical protein
MATLPTPGGDTGTWGTELNEWLLVGHTSGGANLSGGTIAPDSCIFVDASGSDSNGGTSWDDAFLTIAHATDVATAGQMVVVGELPSTAQPSITIDTPIALKFMSGGLGFRNEIIPASSSASVITVDCSNGGVVLEDVRIDTSSYNNFTGIGLNCVLAAGMDVNRFTYFSLEDVNENSAFGGTGIKVTGAVQEQSFLRHCVIQNATKGIHVPGPEGSAWVVEHLRTIDNYQDLVMGDVGSVGGWKFFGWKSVMSGKDADLTNVVNLAANSGDCAFYGCDLTEIFTSENVVLVAGDRHRFYGLTLAPLTRLSVTGDHNRFYDVINNGEDIVLDGDDNHVDGVMKTTAFTNITGGGDRNVIERCFGGTLNVSGDSWIYINNDFDTITDEGTNPVHGGGDSSDLLTPDNSTLEQSGSQIRLKQPIGTFAEFTEIADAAAPSANRGRLYTRDNGSGKTQLVVRFPTGAIQVIATEP